MHNLSEGMSVEEGRSSTEREREREKSSIEISQSALVGQGSQSILRLQ